jgi:lysozyme
MKIGSKGLALIKSFEGYHTKLPDGRCKAYLDKLVRPALRSPGYKGLWTIGWGSTGPDVTEGTVWTEAQAERSLRRLIAQHEKTVKSLVKVSLNQSQYDALVSLSYNVGLHKCKSLVSRLNKGDYAGAANAFLLYNKAGGKVIRGLVRRRTAERALFLSAPEKPEKEVVREVVDNSRKLTLLQRLRLFIPTLGIGSYFTWENATQFRTFVSDHAGFLLLAAGAIVWLVFKYIEWKSVEDYKEGRWVPSGKAAQRTEKVKADV